MTVKLPYKSDSAAKLPAVLKGKPNGQIPAELLVPCGLRNFLMIEPAAGAMRAMVAAAAGDGVTPVGYWDVAELRPAEGNVLGPLLHHEHGRQDQGVGGTHVLAEAEGRDGRRSRHVESRSRSRRRSQRLAVGADLRGVVGVARRPRTELRLLEHRAVGELALDVLPRRRRTHIRSGHRRGPCGAGNGVRTRVRVDIHTGSGAGSRARGLAGDRGNGRQDDGGRVSRGIVEGAKGEAVSAVQWKLVAVGHEVKVDGDFGKKTAAAVVGFPDGSRPHCRRPRRQEDLDRARTASRVADSGRTRNTRRGRGKRPPVVTGRRRSVRRFQRGGEVHVRRCRRSHG